MITSAPPKKCPPFPVKAFLLFCAILILPALLFAQRTPFEPNDPYFFYNETERPYFPGQWHLDNQAPSSISIYSVAAGQTYQMINGGVDANLRGAWGLGYTGRGITIGIVDSGVDSTNYDIAPNYRAALSKNFSDNAAMANAPQGPQSIKDNHGTAVAGVGARPPDAVFATFWGLLVPAIATAQIAYTASKGGVLSMTREIAVEYARNGITVNTIPPGFIDTPMSRRAEERGDLPSIDVVAAHSPMGRAGTPDDIGVAAAFITSDEAGYITGQSINVNGGLYL